MTLRIGAIADDYTGATDLAVTLVKQGMRVLQLFGVPDASADLGAADAVVIALKSRTINAADAVDQSLAALSWLQQRGAEQIFFKYCSTFDSTADGNIGPVADALTDALGAKLAIVCPAFPVNGRVVEQGKLYVNGQLLSESPMKDHPLTPMRDSDLVSLMSAQSDHAVGLIPLEVVRQGAEAVCKVSTALVESGHRYAVVDAVEDEDLVTIGTAAKGHALVTGGSGVALGLPPNFGIEGGVPQGMPRVSGRAVVLSGSCSVATRAQISEVAHRWPHRKLDVDRLFDAPDEAGEAVRWALSQDSDAPCLIYASSDPEEVAAAQQRHGVEAAGEIVEQTFARIAFQLASHGFARFVVAGGETSGAVVAGLGLRALRVRDEIAPGVPWTETLGPLPIALALKSGNFGGADFFSRAFEVLR